MPEMPYHFQAPRYALRELTGTDFLAFRAVAEGGFIQSRDVLDLGCGAGRSSRFLSALGNRVTGVDISPEMIAEASKRDPAGDYCLLSASGDLPFPDRSFDAFFSSWMMVEVGDAASLCTMLREVSRVLRPGGSGIVIGNTPAFYQGNWLTCDVTFPENFPPLRSGQQVRVLLQPEGVRLTDFYWNDADYRSFFAQSDFQVVDALYPLGRPDDSLEWRDEWHTAPHVVYRLTKAGSFD